MRDDLNARVRDFLTEIERQEARLLSWGVVDGGFTRPELEELAADFLERRGAEEDARTLVAELMSRCLLFPLALGPEPIYRTRMAETIRLLARLRQLFPGRPWRVAPTLVADYRFALRPRVYPDRNVPAAELLAQLAQETQLTEVQRRAIEELLLREEVNEQGAVVREPMDLSEFQVRATVRMLQDLRQRTTRAMIVGAGTGTGKTLAFYLPALGYLAALVRPHSHWTKAVAIYPRNELLKDQLQDALQQARKLDDLFQKKAGRKLRIGAYFGDTPYSADPAGPGRKWERRPAGFACPFLRCQDCGGELLWYADDLAAKVERLRCTDCDYVIGEDEFVLTRRSMANTPPDLLFTTTETLNRRISDAASRHVFGVGAQQPPRILLLDEAHTYAGIHGAQVAYLLRRWRHAIGGAPLHICGLSATLQDAGEFFSTLVGLPSHAVDVILPREGDLVQEGVEYQLALRGDPASGASLLSTTIQAVMLLRRSLDSSTDPRSRGAYGRRLFVFTDDLDVTNRLYHSLQDAEGQTPWGKPKRGGVVLASLRAHNQGAEPQERLRAGQSWLMAEEIHAPVDLREPLRVGRTSSQDAGVDPEADVIVATASLEVGFNDPDVGAVVQHKAPLDSASFLQRKGRAGRDRRMRPWTVVVLSDYGRDRIAYQAYDQLFDPVLRTRSLPVGNRHVLRMQAAYALMDWVATQVPPNQTWGSVWSDFAAPPAEGHGPSQRQAWEISLLDGLLTGDQAREEAFRQYLAAALSISEDEVVALLWEAPRALLTAVVPTLLRRLETRWRRLPIGAESAQEPFQATAPLPEFVPENLFSDLNLPEVRVVTPPEFGRGDPLVSSMAVLQAMRTFAPGRASRRFGLRSAVTHWIAPPGFGGAGRPADGERPALLPIDAASQETEYLGLVQVEHAGAVHSLPCYRPWEIWPSALPKEVLPTSNAFLLWRSQIGPTSAGEALVVPEHGTWREILREAAAYTHNQRAHLRVRRFALGSEASLRFRSGSSQDLTVRFVDGARVQPAALGFGLEVDGLVFRCKVPDGLRVLHRGENTEKLRALRTAYFRHCVVEDPDLAKRANVFQREWLVQIYLSALTARALEAGTKLPEANDTLAAGDLAEQMERVLEIIFQSLSTEPDPEREEEETPDSERQKVHKALLHLTSDPAIVAILAERAQALWSEPDEEWHRWLAGRFKATLGGALLEACYRLCPHIEEGDLLLDLDPGPRSPDTLPCPEGLEEIWITESALGGAGHVEALLREHATDPRRFYHLVERALEPSDLEMIDVELTRVLDLLETDEVLAATFEGVRAARSHAELQEQVHAMKRRLAARGILATHTVLNALHTRLLRPGSSTESDALVRRLVRRWRRHEEELGVEIDARVFAYVASSDEELDRSLAHIDASFRSEAQWRFQVLYGLLWPRGTAIRSRVLKSYNPYVNLPDPERELLLDLLRAGETPIDLQSPDWREDVTRSLSRTGFARLAAQPGAGREMRAAITSLAAVPLEIGFLHLYPQVQAVRRSQEGIQVDFYLREAVQ